MSVEIDLLKPLEGKKDSFYGNRSVLVSKKQLSILKSNPIIGELYLSDIGFYPHAKDHFRKRTKGIEENILIYCIDGHGYIQLDEELHKVTKNTYYIIKAKTPHLYWASKSAPWSIYWIHFGGKRSHSFRENFGKVLPIVPSLNSRTEYRIRLFNEILTVMESGFTKDIVEYSNLWLNSLLASFFYVNTFRAAKGYQSRDLVDQSIFFMHENIKRCLKMAEIAMNVNLSESHLSKIFRNKTGTSPMDYFINLKMQEAIRLLSNHKMQIKEVAYALGYNDPFYFSRIFTQHIGSNPTSFLKTSKRS